MVGSCLTRDRHANEPRNVIRAFVEIVTAAGLPRARVHGLRHTAVTQSIHPRAMELIGHSQNRIRDEHVFPCDSNATERGSGSDECGSKCGLGAPLLKSICQPKTKLQVVAFNGAGGGA
jgi:hypothetical protein